ncbi:DinB family protein [Gracilibacillus caseinilyticus]|uniref:DinB family protein n=1 Tax=Gracilibacillus caseinilyticus TaxID=2932256 RepID=A0ABY4EWC3_9BACI|nr:DinB family protein [Gracilibacillus caseinilyticus]UOQ48570.1 DinB family protein [Gracilibacillus caseinilyticus]
MINDLHTSEKMSPIVSMLYAAVKENSERLKFITDGMSQTEIDYKGPKHKANSTAQLIKHISYVDLNWVYRLKDEPIPKDLKEKYGPMLDKEKKLPMIKGQSLQKLMSEYDEVLQSLREVCLQLTDADLKRKVSFGHQNEKTATIRWGLWHMADHNRYHQAHINQLRKWYQESRKLKNN